MKNLYLGLSFVLISLLVGGGTCLATTVDDLNKEFLNAAEIGNITEVESLLLQGAQLSAINHKGRNALILAAEEGHLNVVTFLLEQGINVNARAARGRTALIQAAKMGHTKVVKVLLEHGADVNAKTDKGRTALLQASKNGFPDVVKLLLGHNSIKVDTVRKNGLTPLMLAAELGDIETVKMLISKGADKEKKNDEGKKALDFAENEDIRTLLQ